MLTDSQLQFFQKKILELNSAVFYNQSEAVLKLPNRIISVLDVDDIGQIWFFVQSPTQYLTEFEQEFPAKLDFLRKGLNYFCRVEGHVYLVTDPEEINALPDVSETVKERARKNHLLLKLQATHLEYSEREIKHRSSLLEFMQAFFHKLIHSKRLVYRLYPLQPGSISI